MPQVALDPAYRRVTVEEFLRMDLGDCKAELVDGVIYMMSGALRRHNQVQANVMFGLGARLRGSGCRPYGSDQAVRTGNNSIRFPDVSVYCDEPTGPEYDRDQLIGDPRALLEVLSASTRDNDQRYKLPEYQALAGVQAVIFIDPESEHIRLATRDGDLDWDDRWLEAGQDLPIACLNITLPHTEIFARD